MGFQIYSGIAKYGYYATTALIVNGVYWQTHNFWWASLALFIAIGLRNPIAAVIAYPLAEWILLPNGLSMMSLLILVVCGARIIALALFMGSIGRLNSN